MRTIYCISGLAADERAFAHLETPGFQLKYLPWLTPLPKESIGDYALRMKQGIKEENPILAGLSFGGMMSVEIAKTTPVEKLILISSAKTFHEIPYWMRLSGTLKFNRIFPMKSYKVTEAIQNWFIGVVTEEDRRMVREYRRSASQDYIDWSINQILNWRNEWAPPRLFHVHGDADRIFPIRNITPTHVVKDGGHLMIMNKPVEVNAALKEILSS